MRLTVRKEQERKLCYKLYRENKREKYDINCQERTREKGMIQNVRIE